MDNRRGDSFGIIHVFIYHSPEDDSEDYHFLEPVHKASVGQSLGSIHSTSNEVICFDLKSPKALTSLISPLSICYR